MSRKTLFEATPPLEDGEPEPPLSRKLLWFIGLMLLGVTVVAISAYTLRSFLFIG
ncbi:MAG: hypothetical protein Hens3KO_21710 [Henriciella sp.]